MAATHLRCKHGRPVPAERIDVTIRQVPGPIPQIDLIARPLACACDVKPWPPQDDAEHMQHAVDQLLAEVGRVHVNGWLGNPQDPVRRGAPKHNDHCRKCDLLRSTQGLLAYVWGLRPERRPDLIVSRSG